MQQKIEFERFKNLVNKQNYIYTLWMFSTLAELKTTTKF